MKRLRLLFAAFLAVAFANYLVAADKEDEPGLIEFAKDYPKTGEKAGSILVKGKIQLDKKWFVVRYKAVAEIWPKGGGEVKAFFVDVNRDLTWKETTISGLEQGAEFNVTVEIDLTDGTKFETIKSDPRIAKAK